MSNKVGFTALNFALAALGNDSSGGGGGTGGTVSVKVDSTITGQPGTQASVVNLGNDTNVLLQFTILYFSSYYELYYLYAFSIDPAPTQLPLFLSNYLYSPNIILQSHDYMDLHTIN